MNRREVLLTSGGVFAALGLISTADSADPEVIESAKAVIRDHEKKAQGGNLDVIVGNHTICRQITHL